MEDYELHKFQQESGFFQFIYDAYYFVCNFLATYGWSILGVTISGLMLWSWLQPRIEAWLQAREDAAYHKDPDRVLAREEEIRRAREAQQQKLLAASLRAAELAAEREEKKRQEALEMLKKYGAATSGHRLGSSEDGYLPLSGGASTSSYRAPKRSACGGGGCGR